MSRNIRHLESDIVYFSFPNTRTPSRRQREDLLDSLSNEEFKDRHRFSKEAFVDLVELLKPSLERSTSRSFALDPTTQLSCALRYFAQGGFLPMLGDLYGFSDRTASRCIHDVASAICGRIDSFINWPDSAQIHDSKMDFYVKSNGFPGILGAIDGTHIPLNGPSAPYNESVFVNRKGKHSINCQLVCNSKMKIYSLDARWPGSAHDSFVLRQSEVFDKCEALPQNTWLLGDSGYPQLTWLMTPVRNTRTTGEERYNSKHRFVRSVVERCNGILKMRWRCLTKDIMFRPDRASKIVGACGALHNFALSQGDENFENDEILLDASVTDQTASPRDSSAGLTARDQLIRRVFS